MNLKKQQFDHLEFIYCLAKQRMERLSAPEKLTYAFKSSPRPNIIALSPSAPVPSVEIALQPHSSSEIGSDNIISFRPKCGVTQKMKETKKIDSDKKSKGSKKIEEKKTRKKRAPDPALAASPAKKSKIVGEGKVDFNAQAAACLASCTSSKSHCLSK